MACDWAQQFPSTKASSTFAWYDMAVGLRAYRLGFILDLAARHDRFTDETVRALLESAQLHAQVLRDDEQFAGHSNHGFFQAAGQLALAVRFPEMSWAEADLVQAKERLYQMVHQQYAPDGGHREHSPEYHFMVWDTLVDVLESGLLQDPEIQDFRQRIEAALAWMVAPSGRVLLFGDSAARQVEGTSRAIQPALRYVLSGGADGQPPQEALRVLPDTGYAILRTPWATANGELNREATYLALHAGFHSRAHKHADHLTFVWCERGQDLIVDSGRYGYVGRTRVGSAEHRAGYWYADPKRMYVESTAAHNTVQIDGKDFRRTRVKPFGSALQRAGRQAGLYFLEAEIYHGTVRHARTLIVNPGHWLIVFDWLFDNMKHRHEYVQRFHFAPELDVAVVGGNLHASLLDGSVLRVLPLLPAKLVSPVRGQEQPLLGWISRGSLEFTPTPTAAFRASDVAAHAFATLLTLGPGSDGVTAGRSAANASGRNAVFRWTQGHQDHLVRLTRPPEGPLALSYSTP